jgi:hypothetical protein
MFHSHVENHGKKEINSPPAPLFGKRGVTHAGKVVDRNVIVFTNKNSL